MGLEHVETIEANNQATVEFTNVFDGSADRYVIFVDNFVPDTTGSLLRTRMSSDGGATWDTGASDYASSRHGTESDGGTASSGSGGASEIGIHHFAIGNSPASNDTSTFVTTISDPADSNRSTVMRTKATTFNSAAGFPLRAEFGGGQRLAQSSIDSIQFFPNSGNISSGIFSVYKVTEGAASGKQHIETIEASNQASVDFTNVFDPNDGYDRYEIHADNIIPATDQAELQARFSSDGGSTWDSGASDYAWSAFQVNDTGSVAASGSAGDSHMRVLRYVGNDPANNDTSMANLVVSNPTDSTRATAMRSSGNIYVNSFGSGDFRSIYSGGIRLTQSAIDSIQIYFRDSNIESGTFSVYGIGK